MKMKKMKMKKMMMKWATREEVQPGITVDTAAYGAYELGCSGAVPCRYMVILATINVDMGRRHERSVSL